MPMTDFVVREAIVPTLASTTKEAVIREIVESLRSTGYIQADVSDDIVRAILKREQLTRLRQAATQPEALAQLALQRKINPYPADDVRYIPTVEESIARMEQVTLDDVRDLYERQVGAAAGEIAVVGDFDTEPTAKALGDVLKDWKAGTPYKRIERAATPT